MVNRPRRLPTPLRTHSKTTGPQRADTSQDTEIAAHPSSLPINWC
ncbi:unnamed protein product, partial [Rhizoctonia solani]